MHQVLADVWETRTDSPFPGLTTHAYLWTGRSALFYATAGDGDFDAIEGLGGVAHQYLSHRDEAGPTLKRIAERFGSELHAPGGELADIAHHTRVDVPLDGRHVDAMVWKSFRRSAIRRAACAGCQPSRRSKSTRSGRRVRGRRPIHAGEVVQCRRIGRFGRRTCRSACAALGRSGTSPRWPSKPPIEEEPVAVRRKLTRSA
jgi:hypothetical protein